MMTTRTRRFSKTLGLLALAVLLGLGLGAAPAAAQVSTGEIEALTQDSSGGPMPGVRITVTNPATGFSRTAFTGNSGLVAIAALPPDTYDVVAELEGFAIASQEEVGVRVGQTVRLRFTLAPEVSETIAVTAEAPMVDVFKSDVSTNILPEQIEQLPVQDRDFQRLAFIAPGVQRERGGFRFIQGGPVIGSSGNASQATILVDGVDFTDQALGLARTRFSQDAIQEFRVINNRFDTEIGGSSGGALSIITRSGTNDWKGSVFGFFRDDTLREKDDLAQENNDFSRYQIGATLGGPIALDQTHFFGSLESIDEEDVSLFRPGGAFAGLAEDVEHPFTQFLGLLSLDHQLSEASTLSAKFVYEEYREDNFRVGGVAAPSNGQELNRDNWNAAVQHTKVFAESGRLNEAWFQFGSRLYDEPTNSDDVEEWFSGGNTLRIGNNVVGDLLGDGDYWELRDTFYWAAGENANHDLKVGASIFHVEERSRIDTFQEGLFIYADDTRNFPLLYIFGEGSSDVDVDTDIYSAFIHDDWRPNDRLTVSLGLRYDYDTDGNNPDFEHPLVGDRGVDDDNFQPRLGFTYDLAGDGSSVLRGGAGLFIGRYLLVPSFTELQQNGITGRVVRTNVNVPPFFPLDPNDPANTGFPLPPDISLLSDNLEAPESFQATLGFTRRLGSSGLFFDAEAIWADGDNEIVIRDTNFGGNANPTRPNPLFNQINTYTNEGHSEYKALVLSVNGTLEGGHLIASSVTFADKENIADDFSPVFPTGYPSDPADIEAEFGPSRGQEDFRIVLSAVFHLPWDLSLAPIYEYGSGQPWNRILGYDFNGDGKNSDRAEGVGRNSEDGPDFKQLSLRLTKFFSLGEGRQIELVAEVFNLFDTTNFDVTSIDNAEFLAGPTLANPAAAFIPNPTFGQYRATLGPREFQLGVRYRF